MDGVCAMPLGSVFERLSESVLDRSDRPAFPVFSRLRV